MPFAPAEAAPRSAPSPLAPHPMVRGGLLLVAISLTLLSAACRSADREGSGSEDRNAPPQSAPATPAPVVEASEEGIRIAALFQRARDPALRLRILGAAIHKLPTAADLWPTLLLALEDLEDHIRALASEAIVKRDLSWLGTELARAAVAARPIVAPGLMASGETPELMALAQLGRRAPSQALGVLLEALEADELHTLPWAEAALAAMGPERPAAAALIARAAKHPSRAVRNAAQRLR